MLVERLRFTPDHEQYFTRYSSFTEKSKRRLEFFRRRSLQQISDHGM